MTVSCIIIDDEPVARKGLENYVRKISFLNLLGSYSNPAKIEDAILSTVDLIFLDIKIRNANGLEFYQQLKPAPFAIVISAHSEYALDGFELNVADYLLKPVSFERFQQAVFKVKELKSLKHYNQAYHEANCDYFFIKCDNKIQKIAYDEVLYIEGLSNYIVIHTASKKYLSYLSLTTLMDKLPGSKFIRVHKSYIIAIDKIESVKNNDIFIGGKCLPLSKSYKENFMRLIEEKLLKK